MNFSPKFFFVFLIAVLVIALAFTLLGWLFSFSSLFFVEDLFSFANPIGIIGVILILVIGGFYLFKIGFTVMKNSF